MTNDLRLIHTQGLDEGIRCAMCTNTIKSDKGCDGGCVVNQKMYEKVLKVIEKALEQQPSDDCVSREQALLALIESYLPNERCDTCKYVDCSIDNEPCIDCKVPHKSFYEPRQEMSGGEKDADSN